MSHSKNHSVKTPTKLRPNENKRFSGDSQSFSPVKRESGGASKDIIEQLIQNQTDETPKSTPREEALLEPIANEGDSAKGDSTVVGRTVVRDSEDVNQASDEDVVSVIVGNVENSEEDVEEGEESHTSEPDEETKESEEESEEEPKPKKKSTKKKASKSSTKSKSKKSKSSTKEETPSSPKKKKKRDQGIPLSSVQRLISVGTSTVDVGKKKGKEGTKRTNSNVRISDSSKRLMKSMAEGWIGQITEMAKKFLGPKKKLITHGHLVSAIAILFKGYDTTLLNVAERQEDFELYKKKEPKSGGAKPLLYLPVAAVKRVIKKHAGDSKISEGFHVGMQYFIEQTVIEYSRKAATLAAMNGGKTINSNILIYIRDIKGY